MSVEVLLTDETEKLHWIIFDALTALCFTCLLIDYCWEIWIFNEFAYDDLEVEVGWEHKLSEQLSRSLLLIKNLITQLYEFINI